MAQRPKPKSKVQSQPINRDRTLPKPGTLHKVNGYGTLTIYMMEASPFWYMRYYESGRVIRRSLKVTSKSDAIKEAQKVFIGLKHKKMNSLPLTQRSGFEVCARQLLKENEGRRDRGELSVEKVKYDAARLEGDLLPHFGKYEVSEINYQIINDYISKLSAAPRSLANNSLKIHLSHIKSILKYAQITNVITALPAFPKLKQIDVARPWFNRNEYSALHATCRANIGKSIPVLSAAGKLLRKVTITQELYELIIFMANSFIRPTDIKVLQHKHVTIVRGKENYLRLSHPPTKGHGSPIVTLEPAIQRYENLRALHQAEGFGQPDDYVFQPDQPNRDYALRNLSRQFDQLLRLANLKTSGTGQERSLYSLRHTCIMNRLIKGDDINLLALARNARTSVEMIERFYAKHLTAEMNVAQIQSMRFKPDPTPKPSPVQPKPRPKSLSKKAAMIKQFAAQKNKPRR